MTSSKTILADVSGFTPVIDRMAMEHGLVYAAVFGRMWRFCQMEDGVCKASLDKIASGLHIDKATVMRYAARLVEDGYLRDLTPDLRNTPHVYADTGKAAIRVGIGATVAGCNADIEQDETVAQCNATVACGNATVAHDQLKIVSKIDSKDTKEGIQHKDFDLACAILKEKSPDDYAQASPGLLSSDEKPYRLHVRLASVPPGFMDALKSALRDANTRRHYRLSFETPGTGHEHPAKPHQQRDNGQVVIKPDDSVTRPLPGHQMLTPELAWTAALGELQLEMSRATFEAHVKQTELISVNGAWRVGVPNDLDKEWIEKRLRSTVKRVLSGIVGQPLELEFVVIGQSK